MSVLIVDDESYIVEYLQHLINWKHYGFTEVLATSQPQQALQILQEKAIDLVISDIRMPGISGLDLIKMIHQDYPKTHVMFLSGYSDFEYAQTGIHYGVEDYLLKPITKLDLETALQRYVTHHCPSKPANPEHLIDHFNWLITNVGFYATPEVNPQIIPETSYVFFKQKGRVVQPSEAVVIWSAKETSFGFLPKEYVDQLPKATVSQPFSFENSDQLRQVFYCFFANQNYRQKDLKKVLFLPALQQLKTEERNLKIFEEGYEQAQGSEKLIYLLECLPVLLGQQIPVDPGILLEMAQTELFKAKLSEYFKKLFTQANEKNSVKRVIDRVNEYIGKNLSENLTLEVVANKVYVHPAYLSKLYKQETGENFSVYLANKRMEAAAQLLMDSNLMVSDIGKLVGYRTSQYFIKVFKEKYHMTPQQYRRAHL
ncbi:response regulator transcription factor [Enterococcus sp. AZ194]|uniref:response regulator transcription factor n=1 Tax=Enterococcus sp. AZ194 TaxID=2774629 RepID=UPI003F6867A5